MATTTSLGNIASVCRARTDYTPSSLTEMLLGSDEETAIAPALAVAEEAERELFEGGFTTLGNGEVLVTLIPSPGESPWRWEADTTVDPADVFERAQQAIADLY